VINIVEESVSNSSKEIIIHKKKRKRKIPKEIRLNDGSDLDNIFNSTLKKNKRHQHKTAIIKDDYSIPSLADWA
jgi:hypothetical protein